MTVIDEPVRTVSRAEAVPRTQRKPVRWGNVIVLVVLSVGLAMTILPFVWMVLGAFKTNAEIMSRPVTWWPVHPTLENFRAWLFDFNIVRPFFNRHRPERETGRAQNTLGEWEQKASLSEGVCNRGSRKGAARPQVSYQEDAGQEGRSPQCATRQGPPGSLAAKACSQHRASWPVGGHSGVGPGTRHAGKRQRTDAGQGNHRFPGRSQAARARQCSFSQD